MYPQLTSYLQDGSFHYVKIHLKTNQGVKNLTLAEAVTLTGTDPDNSSRDLFDSIANGDFPSWTVYAQIIDPKAAENYTTNIFDATKTISQTDFPLIPFGKITLNQNPVNFFSEVEQVAFSPSDIVPGWQISPDPSKHPSPPPLPPDPLTSPRSPPNPPLRLRRHSTLPPRGKLQPTPHQQARLQLQPDETRRHQQHHELRLPPQLHPGVQRPQNHRSCAIRGASRARAVGRHRHGVSKPACRRGFRAAETVVADAGLDGRPAGEFRWECGGEFEWCGAAGTE
jgi:hypothetical protein